MNKMSSRSHVILEITVKQFFVEKRKSTTTDEITKITHRAN